MILGEKIYLYGTVRDRNSESILPLWTQLLAGVHVVCMKKFLQSSDSASQNVRCATGVNSLAQRLLSLNKKGVCNIVQQQDSDHCNIKDKRKKHKSLRLPLIFRRFISSAIITTIYHYFFLFDGSLLLQGEFSGCSVIKSSCNFYLHFPNNYSCWTCLEVICLFYTPFEKKHSSNLCARSLTGALCDM